MDVKGFQPRGRTVTLRQPLIKVKTYPGRFPRVMMRAINWANDDRMLARGHMPLRRLKWRNTIPCTSIIGPGVHTVWQADRYRSNTDDKTLMRKLWELL